MADFKPGCQWDGDCDHCGSYTCIATEAQCKQFYAKEEAATKSKYGNKIIKDYIPEGFVGYWSKAKYRLEEK